MKTIRFFMLLMCMVAVLMVVQATAYASDPLLQEIRFKKVSDREEKVFLVLNGPYIPEALGLKGGTPRLTCDFKNMRPSETIPSLIDTQGNFILRIRVERHGTPCPRTTVILDLAPHLNYTIPQAFLQPDNMYVISICPDNAVRRKPAALPSGEMHHR
jgi:hypothetical protein